MRVYGDADREALKAAFVRIREKLGGLKMQEALDALDAGTCARRQPSG